MALLFRHLLCLILVCMGVGHAAGAAAQVDGPPDSEARQVVLRQRLAQIEAAQQESDLQYREDKRACAPRTLVNACLAQALARRRARDEVLARDDLAARSDLRALVARDKHQALAQAMPTPEQVQAEKERQSQAREALERKQRDVEERRADHRRKQAQEADNRKAWEDKQARAAEKQAEIEARRRARDAAPAAGAAGAAGPAAGDKAKP